MDNEVGMSPQEIADVYSVLAGQTQDYTNSLIGRAGAAQSSLGTLADQVKGQSQTAGMGNYTYNRLVRPQLDSLTSSLVAKGVSDALNKQLYSALEQAKRNYSSGGGNGGGGTTPVVNDPGWDGGYENEEPTKTPLAGTLLLGDSYTVITPDGNRTSYRRPDIMSDMQWFNWVEAHRRQAEAEGNKFIIGE